MWTVAKAFLSFMLSVLSSVLKNTTCSKEIKHEWKGKKRAGRLPTVQEDCQQFRKTANSSGRLPTVQEDCQQFRKTDNSSGRLTTVQEDCQQFRKTANSSGKLPTVQPTDLGDPDLVPGLQGQGVQVVLVAQVDHGQATVQPRGEGWRRADLSLSPCVSHTLATHCYLPRQVDGHLQGDVAVDLGDLQDVQQVHGNVHLPVRSGCCFLSTQVAQKTTCIMAPWSARLLSKAPGSSP